MPEDQEQKLALIDELAFYLGPILEPGAAAEPLDTPISADAPSSGSARASPARRTAGGNPGATRLAAALDRFIEAAAERGRRSPSSSSG